MFTWPFWPSGCQEGGGEDVESELEEGLQEGNRQPRWENRLSLGYELLRDEQGRPVVETMSRV
ncbi:MAG: hypothetical protein C4521_13210 [Actinobacteria bacterium]|nr:MAG: hypothetical protein C4521_13210 [Actinomycetota bacterium]